MDVIEAPARGQTSRDRRREDTRQRIYEAAMDIFRRDGFGVARVDDVARAAGVSHGTFYFHFATKDDVLLQCNRIAETNTVTAIEALPRETNIASVLEATAVAVARQWEHDAGIFPDVAMVALRHVFCTHVALAARINDDAAGSDSTTLGDPECPAETGSLAPGAEQPRRQSLVSLTLADRFRVAAAAGLLTRQLPPRILADLFLVNLLAAHLSWCAAPSERSLEDVLRGVLRLYLHGVSEPQPRESPCP